MNRYLKGFLPLVETQVDGISLMRNENFFLGSKVAETAASQYPSSTLLRESLAVIHNVEPSQIILGAGATGVMHAVFHATSECGARLRTQNYTYNPAVQIAMKHGFNYDDEFPVVDSLFLVHPNNPTGLPEIPTLTDFQNNKYVIVDEAYIEYHPELQSYVELIHKTTNLIVIRTFSKAYGLAGARIGYAVCSKGVANYIKRSEMMYSVSTASLDAAFRAISPTHKNELDSVISKTAEARQFVFEEFQKRGISIMQPCANFITAKIPDIKGYATRDLKEYSGLDSWRRVTIANKNTMNNFFQAIDNEMGIDHED